MCKQLTDRQIHILSLLREYKNYTDIANELGVSKEAIRITIPAIIRRLGDRINDPEYLCLLSTPSEFKRKSIQPILFGLCNTSTQYEGTFDDLFNKVSAELPFKLNKSFLRSICKESRIFCRKRSKKEKTPLEIGAIYGFWQVVKRSDNSPANSIMYDCKCILCGIVKPTSKNNIIRGLSKSCGKCAVSYRDAKGTAQVRGNE